MVEVGMGDPDLADLPIAPFGLDCNQVPVPGGIDDGRIASIGVGDQIGVCCDRTKEEGYDFEQITLWRRNNSSLRSAAGLARCKYPRQDQVAPINPALTQ